MSEAVLFVDDESAILDGYKRMLYRDFTVHTAVGGPAGLAAIRDKGPYAVVVSDMRMPGMAGSTFLAKVREATPNTVRMLLTGYSDMQDAAAAVNDGNIFRYLNKPCTKEDLCAALQMGLAQHRMAQAETEMLEGTLLGSIRALSEVLSAVNPEAFERSTRVSNCVRHLISRMQLTAPWRVEAAAMLSQVGCLALAPELIRDAHQGTGISPEAQARFDAHAGRASELVAHIPRMEAVAWIIRRQIYGADNTSLPGFGTADMEELGVAGEMLRLAVAFDTLWLQGMDHASAVFELRRALHSFPSDLLEGLETMKPIEKSLKPARLPVAKLQVDMIVNEDVRNHSGALMVGGGQSITKAMLIKLREFVENRLIPDEICVLVFSADGACAHT